ncbi:hypothetical protein BFN03_18530 [Rhodococcus sp. WMMA185]|uniref:hypothetical protein n=1 Tax=Rhodococcus sp. WMMA185 TaxID=679318 RepID=UPI0008781025|nr:hypothetical protein [Rhodococcus sp. WMMA185]AOW93986.1 hypothetical protein BFN03_18530 [Rhodococcus sp. WMMA185]
MKSIHRWAGIAATATTLAAGTLLFPGGVASALPPLPGNNIKTTDINFATSCQLIGPNRKPNTGTAFTGGANGTDANGWGVQVTAPATVTPGQEFTYRIQPDPITAHKILDNGSLVLWRDIRYDVDIPPGTEFVGAKVASDPTTPFQNTPTITRIDPNGKKNDNGSILRMDINEDGRLTDLESDENLSTGTHINGWVSKQNPGFLSFPAMDITIKAGDAGAMIEPTLRVSTDSDPDASTFGSADNFFRVIAVSHNNAGDSDTIVYCSPHATPKSTTVTAGGKPLTTIPVVVPAAPGSYRTAGPTGNGTCDWKRIDTEGSVVERGTTVNPTTLTIGSTDVGFTSTNCAPWNPVSLGNPDSAAPKVPGYNFTGAVGVDLQPGSYRSDGSSDGQKSCLWSRQDSSGNTFDAGTTITNPVTVTIEPTDGRFQSLGCDDWTPLSQ